MTTIVGVYGRDGNVCLGADSMSVNEEGMAFPNELLPVNKITNLYNGTDQVYMGITGSGVHKGVIKDILLDDNGVWDNDGYDFMTECSIKRSVNRLHDKLKSDYHYSPHIASCNHYEQSSWDMLIANKNGLFWVDACRDVVSVNKFWAIGSGANYALGSMNVVFGLLVENDARIIAEVALKTATKFDAYTGGPYHFFEVGLAR